MLHSIQSCRAIAALLVVLFHAAGNLAKTKYFGAAAEPLERLFWFGGNAGVAFFFVLSGFIIHRTHHLDFDHPERLGGYLYKRVVRIYPPYLIVFVGLCVVAWAVPWLNAGIPTDPAVFVKSLLLVPQDRDVVGGTGAPVVVVAWSLQYEILFYGAFAVALVSRRAFHAVVAISVAGILLQPILGPYAFPGNLIASHLVLLFGMGMLVSMALISGYRPSSAARMIGVATLAFIATGAFADITRTERLKPACDLAYGLAAAALVFALARYEEENKIGESPLSSLGNSSYALYLIHFPLVAVLSKVAAKCLPVSPAGAVIALLAIVPCCVATAEVFHRVVERPLLGALSRRPQAR